jgi:mono/diheme cytochrome c family protein
MKKLLGSIVACLSCLLSALPIPAADSGVYATPEEAAQDPDFALQGEYVGTGIGVQVIAVGDGEFELVFHTGGLPGAGWDQSPPQRMQGDAELLADVIRSKQLRRLTRSSPTLGAKPPTGAIALFDGTQASLDRHWQAGPKLTEDGLLIPAGTTKNSFRDYTLHLEFRTPYQPRARGQARGNSGVYHQGRYETQILDSFGLEGKSNEAGGIYQVRDPEVNACFPPLTWQTYDIDFTAPRLDEQGKKMSNAKLTVRLNGIVVQRETPVPAPTRAARFKDEDSGEGPIFLQNHKDPVRFRNIWILPRDAEKESRRPLIPGYERFSEESLVSGRILIQQLGCVACHASDDPLLAAKAAPALEQAASRLRPDFVRSFIEAPQRWKAGTTMPDLMHGLEGEQREEAVTALASFLLADGTRQDRSGDSAAAERGRGLYATIGCIACHAPREGAMEGLGGSVPLGDLVAKYTLDSLTDFLENPLAIRPSGFMPKLAKNREEARDLACYLLGDKIIAPGTEQFTVKVYHGQWEKLPDFESLEAVTQGITSGLDLSIAGRQNDFGLRFESYFPVTVAGDYTFTLGSDDGSRLAIDGEVCLQVDGVHPYQTEQLTRFLEIGMHPLRIDYFERGGGEQLTLEVSGPGLEKSPITESVTADPQGAMRRELIESHFQVDRSLIDRGRELFSAMGCAQCHRSPIERQTPLAQVQARKLDELRPDRGCLASTVESGLPDYALTRNQRAAIEAVLVQLHQPLDDQMASHLQLASMNCYACHSRHQVMGPEPVRDRWFQTTMPEMGNEGRSPPSLTGVGDKLRPEVIDHILAHGAKDRPYMLTRMPGFGQEREKLLDLRQRLVRLDERTSTAPPIIHDLKSEVGRDLAVSGRKLAGNGGLACIKCHRFGERAASGIAAIDLLSMPERLRPDWFRRYLLAPTEYRPGTRMPLSFPDGRSVLTSIYEGDAHRQIDALWHYLSQGRAAKAPSGLDIESIVLAPDARPVIYRNFLEGLSPRGIAVGYPQQLNVAWDAGHMSLALLWKNEFIDAGKHWSGRGAGSQGPQGDLVVPWEATSPVARLESLDQPWPTDLARQRGYRFLGYQLNPAGEPSFRYRLGDIEVEDRIRPIAQGQDQYAIERELHLRIPQPTSGLTFRAATGSILALGDGHYQVNDTIHLQLEGVALQRLSIGEHMELRGELPSSGHLVIREVLRW